MENREQERFGTIKSPAVHERCLGASPGDSTKEHKQTIISYILPIVTMYWPAFEWMGANPVVPAPEEGAPLDDVPDSLFNFGEEDDTDQEYDDILGIYDELGGDEFDGFNAYEFFNTMEEDDLADISFLLQALGPKTRQRGIKFRHTRKSWEELLYMLVQTNNFEDRFRMVLAKLQHLHWSLAPTHAVLTNKDPASQSIDSTNLSHYAAGGAWRLSNFYNMIGTYNCKKRGRQ
jgi:hypothetical protein